MTLFNFESLINSTTCFQSTNPTCIDLILTNKRNNFFKFKHFSSWGIGSAFVNFKKLLTKVDLVKFEIITTNK